MIQLDVVLRAISVLQCRDDLDDEPKVAKLSYSPTQYDKSWNPGNPHAKGQSTSKSNIRSKFGKLFPQAYLLSRCEASHVVEGHGVVGPYLVVIGLVIERKWEHSLDTVRQRFSSLPLKGTTDRGCLSVARF